MSDNIPKPARRKRPARSVEDIQRDEYHKKITRSRVKATLYSAIEILDKLFNNQFADKEQVPALDFVPHIGGMYSETTLRRARKALGIVSVSMRGHHFWMRPKRTYDTAIHTLGGTTADTFLDYQVERQLKQVSRRLSTPALVLEKQLTDHNYQIEATHIIDEFESLGYCRRTAVRVKKELGVLSFQLSPDKLHEHKYWLWAWGAPEVQQWLIEQLDGGPVLRDTLISRAAGHGWSVYVLTAARVSAGGIQTRHVIGKGSYWYDINSDAQEVV